MKNVPMNDKSNHFPASSPAEPSEGARRATGEGSAGSGRENRSFPDPEVSEKKKRRRLTAQYKLRILKEADRCKESGQIGALMRREGLYSSSLTRWRRQRDKGLLKALDPKKRGRKPVETNPLTSQIKKLEKDNESLRKKLWKAERIIEVQKKISEILEISQQTDENERNRP